MREREKYIIAVGGEVIKVTLEVYGVYYRAERKERHFMCELRARRLLVIKHFIVVFKEVPV